MYHQTGLTECGFVVDLGLLKWPNNTQMERPRRHLVTSIVVATYDV